MTEKHLEHVDIICLNNRDVEVHSQVPLSAFSASLPAQTQVLACARSELIFVCRPTPFPPDTIWTDGTLADSPVQRRPPIDGGDRLLFSQKFPTYMAWISKGEADPPRSSHHLVSKLPISQLRTLIPQVIFIASSQSHRMSVHNHHR